MKDVLLDFDKYLNSQNKKFCAIVIGGSALNIMDVTNRFTKDVDLIDPEIPEDIKKLSVQFTKEFKEYHLDSDWLNNGPISIIRDLPKDWRLRTQVIFTGEAITLSTLGRLDLLKTKLFAMCDRAIDLDDCIKLNPTLAELEDSRYWVLQNDASELWPMRVEEMFSILKKRLGY